MRRLFVGFLVCFVMAGLVPVTAHADVGDSQQINVHGEVLPARYIIVNQQGGLQQILSNTSENVTPRVYVESIQSNNERRLNNTLLVRYRLILSHTKQNIGVLYTAKPVHNKPDKPRGLAGSYQLKELRLISFLSQR